MSKMRALPLIVSALFLSAASVGLNSSSAYAARMARQQQKPQLQEKTSRESSQERILAFLVKEIRHQLILLPFYNVFDWLEGAVTPDGKVILRGQVAHASIKSDAENSVRKVEGVEQVDNEIEILPASPNDERLRVKLYHALYDFNSPLFRYATQAVPPIHIIVKNGRATLKGVVANEMDSKLAYTKARGVGGLFEVTNELKVENSDNK